MMMMEMSFSISNQSKKRKVKRITYFLLFVGGLAVAIGAYIHDDNYGTTAQLATAIGLMIALCASVMLLSSRHALFMEKKVEKNKRTILLFFITISIFSALLFIYADVTVYRLPGHLIELNEFSAANSEMKIYFDHFGRDIEFESDRLRLVGTVYGIENETVRPGVVIIHGSTPLGRKLPLYRILAKKLVDRGYIVLTYDVRGFGESDDPEEIDDVKSWNSTNDTIQAVSYLCSFKNVNISKIYVIGHSAGADGAMPAGIMDERIKKIVAIGPPRRVKSRILEKNAPDLQYGWKRFSRDRKIGRFIKLNTFLTFVLKSSNMYDDYFYGGHIPILLIDGELEGENDLLFLRATFKNMTEPKKYITLNDTGHYCNTTGIGNFMIYNDRIITETVNVIDGWFNE